MDQDKTAKDEIAGGMANAGREQADKAGTATQTTEREPHELRSDIAEAGAKASPKIPSSGSVPKPAD